MAEGNNGAAAHGGEKRSSQADDDNQAIEGFVLNAVMDGMKSNVYITDPKNDRILFMNRTMKEDFGLEHPEGEVCWKILQKGLRERCSFCPVTELMKRGAPSVIQWEEESCVTGRSYRNYDSLISWLDGSLVHLQQSIDMTEWKTEPRRTDRYDDPPCGQGGAPIVARDCGEGQPGHFSVLV